MCLFYFQVLFAKRPLDKFRLDMYYEYSYYPYDYTITYNLNGGTNSSSNPTSYNVLYGFTLAAPTREGYTFAGWTDVNGNKVTGINLGKNASFATNATYEGFCNELAGRTIGNQTLTANWIANSYTVKYDTNNGAGLPDTQTKVHDTTLILTYSTPTKTGYTFLGWSTDKNATVAEYLSGSEYTKNADLTLYAVWEKGCEDGKHEFTYEVATAPTTAENGTIRGECTICSETKNITIPQLNPTDYSVITISEATCTDNGVKEYTWNTTVYGEYSFSLTIPATGHSYIEVIVSPDCEAQGYTEHLCLDCEDLYRDEYTDALGHEYSYGICVRCEAKSPDFGMGDLTGDGKVNVSDMFTFKSYMLGTLQFEDGQMSIADIDSDGNVNLIDLFLLKKYITHGMFN